MPAPDDALPELSSGDLYLYAHGDGSLTAFHGDGRSARIAVEPAESLVGSVLDHGNHVWVGGQNATAAIDSLTRLGAVALARGTSLLPFEAPSAPTRRAPGGNTLSITTFSWTHRLWVSGWFLLPLVVVALAVVLAVMSDLPLVGIAVGTLIWIGAFASIVPGRALWAGGSPCRLTGTELTVRGPFGSVRSYDLGRVSFAAMGGAPAGDRQKRARWMLLVHPDGYPVRPPIRRLSVCPSDQDDLDRRADRLLVILLDGKRVGEVIGPVARIFRSRSIPVSDGFRSEVELAARPR